MCNLYLKQISFLSIQTLHNDCSHTEDVHRRHRYSVLQDRYKIGLNARNPVFRVYEQKGADQPAYPRRVICVHVSRFMESIISKLASSEASLYSESSFVGNPADMFNRDEAIVNTFHTRIQRGGGGVRWRGCGRTPC